MIGSMDVKSLYPNLDIKTVIEIVGEQFLLSKIQNEGVDYEEIGLYIALNRSKEYIRSKKMTAVCPTRKRKNGKPLITGSGSLTTKAERFAPWYARERDPNEDEQRNMLKEAVMIALKLVLENHA